MQSVKIYLHDCGMVDQCKQHWECVRCQHKQITARLCDESLRKVCVSVCILFAMDTRLDREHCKPMLCCNRFLVFIHTQIDTHTNTYTRTPNLSFTCTHTQLIFLHVIDSPVPLSFFLYFFIRSVFVSHSIHHVALFRLPPRILLYGRFLLSCSVFLDSLSLCSALSSVSLCCHSVWFFSHTQKIMMIHRMVVCMHSSYDRQQHCTNLDKGKTNETEPKRAESTHTHTYINTTTNTRSLALSCTCEQACTLYKRIAHTTNRTHTAATTNHSA